MRTIFLIGFMGCGKTTVSQELGSKLKLPVIDSDQLVEEREHKKIRDIFSGSGEEYFRRAETLALKETAGKPAVVSCGGGAVLREENVEIMKREGTVVWLTAAPQTILERCSKSNDRPILNGHMNVEYIEGLMKEREKYYRAAADLAVETDGKTAGSIAEEIADWVNR